MSNWRDFAACKDKPTVWWFPESKEIGDQDVAISICLRCPVKAECFDYALDHEIMGIWGGVNQTDRAKIRRKNKLQIKSLNDQDMHPNCGTDNGYQALVRESRRNGTKIRDCASCRKAHAESDRLRKSKKPDLYRATSRIYAQKRSAQLKGLSLDL
jgi:WhiB family redox-sensing transcriptional regulator